AVSSFPDVCLPDDQGATRLAGSEGSDFGSTLDAAGVEDDGSRVLGVCFGGGTLVGSGFAAGGRADQGAARLAVAWGGRSDGPCVDGRGAAWGAASDAAGLPARAALSGCGRINLSPSAIWLASRRPLADWIKASISSSECAGSSPGKFCQFQALSASAA